MEIYFQIYLIFDVITLLYSAPVSHLPQTSQIPQIQVTPTDKYNAVLSNSSLQSIIKEKQVGHPKGGQEEKYTGPETTTRLGGVPIFDSGKEVMETNFRDTSDKNLVGVHAVASCLICIFDKLNPNTQTGWK